MKTRPIKSSGFTLIEILVATAIFATVMIIVVATFTWAAGYNNRLKETRRVGQEVRNAMDQFTRDVRLANGSGKWGSTNIGEITLFRCASTSSCSIVYQDAATRYKDDLAATTDPSGITSPKSNAVLVLNQDQDGGRATFYRSLADGTSNFKFELASITQTNLDSLSLLSFSGAFTTTYQNDPVKLLSMQAYFGGYGGAKAGRAQQPYVEIYLIGQTYNYNTIAPNMRSKFHLRTMVESRDYN